MSATNRKVINLAITITTSLVTCLIVLGIAFQIWLPSEPTKTQNDKGSEAEEAVEIHQDFYRKASLTLPDSLPYQQCKTPLNVSYIFAQKVRHPISSLIRLWMTLCSGIFFGDEFSNPQEYESEATGFWCHFV